MKRALLRPPNTGQAELYIDLDYAGRTNTSNPSPTASKRTPAQFVGRNDNLVVPDLCGRGDPKVFAEISRRITTNAQRHGQLDKDDLKAIAENHQPIFSQKHHHHRSSARRTFSQPLRKSHSAYLGVCRLLGISRS